MDPFFAISEGKKPARVGQNLPDRKTKGAVIMMMNRTMLALSWGMVWVLAGSSWLVGAVTGAGPVAEWRFDDPAGAPLQEYVALDVDGDGPVWLVAEVRGWELSEGEEGAVGFGLWNEAEAAGGLAELRLELAGDGRVAIRGIGHARGTDVEGGVRLANPRREAVGLALYYDPAAHLYQVFVREGEAWELIGTGATRDERGARFVRLALTPAASQSTGRGRNAAGAGVDVERIYVTQSPLVRQDRDPEAPPFVTATAWAIADGRTGEIIASHELDAPRKNASITKAMCALVVIRMAEEDPSILEEMVTFSELAANTGGSSARIGEGERLRLGDALFALMLPSGNDVGNAIAEHFHDRLDPPEDAESVPESRATRANFVAEMNRVAAEIGMKKTIYRIPFGDGGSAEDHTTTAADLMVLARTAFEYPLFREVVGTREYSATVTQPDGGMREATWRNTNQFLGRDGFDGIKTGTTRTAGACVLSTARRGEDRLFMVVLGSSYSSRRYIDSEALYDWAWERLVEQAGR